MAKEKATITVDGARLSEARELLGMSSSSGVIDVALSQLVHRQRVLRDARAYAETAPTPEEGALGEAAPDWRDLADDTDWDAEWPPEA
ncbi:MAG: hypothetical protein ACRDWE_07335 [Acidimicrobiales bacterium]